MRNHFASPVNRTRLLALALILSASISGAEIYFSGQQSNTFLPESGGLAPGAGGSVSEQPKSPDGAIVLAHSIIAPTLVASPQGIPDGYRHYVTLGQEETIAGTEYKQQQNGSTIPWDIRFPGVLQLIDGMEWPLCANCDKAANFDEPKLLQSAERFRVAIRANPYDLDARRGLIATYQERMLAHVFAGNNAAQYASGHRLNSGTIAEEIAFWAKAITQYRAATDIFAEATGLLPDAETFSRQDFSPLVEETFDVFARALAYESEAVRRWLQLSYLASFRDPLAQTYDPAPLLRDLQPYLDHLQTLLLLGSEFTHLRNYLESDIASAATTFVFLEKEKASTIPRGLLSFAGQRAVSSPGEIIGSYAPFYVPYLDQPGDDALTSFDELIAQASAKVSIAAASETAAKNANRAFDTDRSQLAARLDEIFSNYNTQLGELCGWILGADNQLHADVIGCILPPGERERERPFRNGESSGKIYQQNLVISQALVDLEAAEQDRRNIYLKAVNAKTVGDLIAQQSENLAQMYLNDGASLAALEKLRGEETARTTREIARKQAEQAERERKRGLWGNILKIGAVIGSAVLTIVAPPAGAAAGYATAALIAGSAATASATYNTWAENANAHGRVGLILQTGELQAHLAEVTAEIEAQKEKIRASEAATVQFAQRDATLWRTEEAWQAAMLDYERAALNVLMAEQRLVMQKAELANLHSRVAFLLQEMRKAVAINSKTVNPLSRPDYRLWLDYTRQGADENFLIAQEWVYLAARSAQYKINEHPDVTDTSLRIEAILRSRLAGGDTDSQNPCNPGTLCFLKERLKDDVATLNLRRGSGTIPISATYSLRNYIVQNNFVQYTPQGDIDPVLSLMETQLSGTNTVAASDAAWLEFLKAHLHIDAESGLVSLEIPFATSLQRPRAAPGPGFDPFKQRVNPLYDATMYAALIESGSGGFGVRINIRGRSLTLNQSLNVQAKLLQQGASYIRTRPFRSNPVALRLWQLEELEGRVQCSVNQLPAGLRTSQFDERSPANDRWLLVIDNETTGGDNNLALLNQLQNISDIEIQLSVRGFTN